MKPNDFDTNISYKHSKTFSTRMRILLFLALFMTGLISTVGIIQIVGSLCSDDWLLFLASSVLFPRLPGYHSSGIEIFSYGSFVLIDGINLTLGILIIIFGCLIHEGLRMQKDLDEVL